MALLAAYAAAAKTQAAAQLAGGVRDVFAGLTGGMTKNDRERLARVNAYLARANAGDQSALLQLAYNAYEDASRNLPGDDRRGLRGMSPGTYRSYSERALKSYVAERGGVPPSLRAYAERIGATVLAPPPSFADALRGAVTQGVAQGAAQGTADAAGATVRAALVRYRPWLIGGTVAVVALVAWRVWGKRR